MDAALRESASAISFCADFTEASVELTASLPPTEARLHTMLRGQTVICRCALRLAALCPARESPESEERMHLSRSSKAIGAAFKLHQRYVQASGGAPPPCDDKTDPLPSTLQVLNFEVALRRADPNAKEVLRKVAETESVSTAQLRVLADLSFDCRSRELGMVALEQCLSRLLVAEPRHHSEIAAVLRLLIRSAESRGAALPYFKTAMRLLDGFSDANAPLSTDELQWLLAEAWNKVGQRRSSCPPRQMQRCLTTHASSKWTECSWRYALSLSLSFPLSLFPLCLSFCLSAGVPRPQGAQA